MRWKDYKTHPGSIYRTRGIITWNSEELREEKPEPSPPANGTVTSSIPFVQNFVN